jgi:hypothetical protein
MEMVKAKVAATNNARPINGKSITLKISLGEAPRDAAACLNLGWML